MMSKYKLTTRGKITGFVLAVLALISIYFGKVTTAVFVFAFCLVAICLLVYDFYFNGRGSKYQDEVEE